jgi:hypothetical protein
VAGPRESRTPDDFRDVLARAPILEGRSIRITFRPRLRVRRGKLISAKAGGEEVHAGAHLRKRRIVLDSDLAEKPGELARILIHELFHFAWIRLGNPRRRIWEEILVREFRRKARGELGWSAESRKRRLTPGDVQARSRAWREYVCESFCDSAGWLYSGLRRHEEFRLGASFRAARRVWFQRMLTRAVPI